MRPLVFSAAGVIALIFSAAIFPNINIAGLSPDIIVCIIASITILEKSMAGAVLGLACGLLLDLFFTGAVGFFALPYFVTGAMLYFTCKNIRYIDRYLLPVLLAGGAYMCKEFILTLISYIMDKNFLFGYMFLRFILPETLMTGAFMLLIHFFLSKIYRTGTMKNKSDKDFKRLL